MRDSLRGGSEYAILHVGLRIRDSLRGAPNTRFFTYQNPIWGPGLSWATLRPKLLSKCVRNASGPKDSVGTQFWAQDGSGGCPVVVKRD